MACELEIVVPLRNPTEVLRKTAESLGAQTDRSFSVLISDNHSTRGLEFVQEAIDHLTRAGIPVRRCRPPEEIGRVEHWNWSHRQAIADWIKPLFVGDWLEARYVERTRAAIAAGPDVDIINCSVGSHNPDGGSSETVYPGGFRSPKEVLAAAFANGNCFGGPINICFKRFTFDLVGGYPPALPVSADFWLILMLALRKGLMTCPEVLTHFNYHPDRFSTNFPMHRINGPREYFVILSAATSLAAFNETPHAVGPRNRLFLRLIRDEARRRLRRGK